MKISKDRLIQIIKEEIDDASKEQGLGRGSTTASQAKKSFRQSGETMADPDVTAKERQIMNQMKDVIEKASKELDIGTGGAYAVLQRVYKLLGKAIQQQGAKDEQ